MRHDLWDVEPGNCLGRSGAEEATSAVVRALVRRSRPGGTHDPASGATLPAR